MGSFKYINKNLNTKFVITITLISTQITVKCTNTYLELNLIIKYEYIIYSLKHI